MKTVYVVKYRDPSDPGFVRIDTTYSTLEQAETHAVNADKAEGSKGLTFFVEELKIDVDEGIRQRSTYYGHDL